MKNIPDTRHKSFMICAPPRTGSNYICNMLYSTTLYSQNNVNCLELSKGCALGIFAHWQNLPALTENMGKFYFDEDQKYDIPTLAFFKEKFPDIVYIYTYRLNTIRQAVSFEKANVTGNFSCRKRVEETDAVFQQIKANGIKEALNEIGLHQSLWQDLFAEHDIMPYRIAYEDMVGEHRFKVIQDLLNHLKLDIDASTLNTDLEKQSNVLSNQYYNAIMMKYSGRKKEMS